MACHQPPRAGRRTAVLALLLVAPVAALSPRALVGQTVVTSRGWQEATTGSELETYLRILQLAGKSPLYPWSVRGFSPQEIDRLTPRDTLHPWAARLQAPAADSARGLRVAVLRPDVRLIYNSAYPWAQTDGVVWAGRGLTASLQLGVQARYGPLSLTLDPIVFDAENAAFPLLPNGLSGPRSFGSGITPNTIDLPQRFGSKAYTRIDPGQSTLRLDLSGVALGVSTANQIWGPSFSQPLIIGNAGPGFPHVFAGTSAPVDLWIGHLHGLLEVGRLAQSAYSPMPPDSGSGLMASLVATFVPRWTPGLEVGFTRFFRQPWPIGGIRPSDFLIPFEGLFLTPAQVSQKYNPSNPNYTPQDQLASFFARWVFPKNGVELFGEFAREDRNADVRDFLLEPDHESAFALGFVKLLRRSAQSYSVVRAELANGRPTLLQRLRGEPFFYVHNPLLQGHTNRGILLGSPAVAYGGVGETVALDVYRPDGRWTLEGSRQSYQMPGEGAGPRGYNVTYALRAERLFFRRGWDCTVAVTPVFELNRNFARDAFDLRLEVGARVALSGRE